MALPTSYLPDDYSGLRRKTLMTQLGTPYGDDQRLAQESPTQAPTSDRGVNMMPSTQAPTSDRPATQGPTLPNSSRDQALRQVSQAYSGGGLATGGDAGFDESTGTYRQQGTPYSDLRNLFNRYQNEGGQWQQYGVRSVAMDRNTGEGNSDRFAGENVSADAPGYVNPDVAYAIEQGIIDPSQVAQANWIARHYGDIVYRPGERLDLSDIDPNAPGRADGITGLDRNLGGRGNTGALGGITRGGLMGSVVPQNGGGNGGEFSQGNIRQMLMQQLGQLSQPVSVDAPGIKEALAGQRLGLQRSAEAARREAAERRAVEGFGPNSAQFGQDVERIQQRQGEAEAQMTGEALFGQLDQRRQSLNQLLAVALASGDAESARNLQAELAKLQMAQQESQFGRSLSQRGREFESDLGFRRDALSQADRQFQDRLGFDTDVFGANYGLGLAGLNQQALLALLGLI